MVIGNHEFEYGHEVFAWQRNRCKAFFVFQTSEYFPKNGLR